MGAVRAFLTVKCADSTVVYVYTAEHASAFLDKLVASLSSTIRQADQVPEKKLEKQIQYNKLRVKKSTCLVSGSCRNSNDSSG